MICVAGCGGEPAVLGGSSGGIGIIESLFMNSMECAWNISVDKNKVNNLRNILIITPLIKTHRSR